MGEASRTMIVKAAPRLATILWLSESQYLTERYAIGSLIVIPLIWKLYGEISKYLGNERLCRLTLAIPMGEADSAAGAISNRRDRSEREQQKCRGPNKSKLSSY